MFIRYPAKLMVDKVVIRDEFPDRCAVLNGKREVTVGNVEPLLKQPQSCSIFPNVPPRPINAVHVSENINERTFHSNNSESRGINIVPQPGQSITETWENVPLNVPQSKSTVSQPMSMSVTQSVLTPRPTPVPATTSGITSFSPLTPEQSIISVINRADVSVNSNVNVSNNVGVITRVSVSH